MSRLPPRSMFGRLGLLALLSACHAAPSREGDAARGASTPDQTARLYEGFEGFTRPVATSSPLAQQFVDHGLQWLYGFNDDEAIRCFREAVRLDPDCAFAWWGIAYACGINVNDPVMSEKESREAWEAIEQALARAEHATPVERELIDAVRKALRTLSDAVLCARTVSFRYHGMYRDEVTERTVAPYGLLFQHDHWYLVGHDHLRDAVTALLALSRWHDRQIAAIERHRTWSNLNHG